MGDKLRKLVELNRLTPNVSWLDAVKKDAATNPLDLSRPMEILPPLPVLVPLPKPAGSQLPITASRKDNNRASRLPAKRPLSPLSFKAKAIAAQPRIPKVHQWIVVPSKDAKKTKKAPVAP